MILTNKGEYMAVFRCKMCGGDLEITDGMSVCECAYCGTKQTLPKLDDEKKANLYDRANHFRRNNEYDKAMSIYENILNEDKTDAETYWSLVLCKYGIEYVEDPSSHKRIPTVNRTQFASIFADEDYKQAIQYADGYQKDIYEAEAKAIDEIQKGILEISNQEEPFDVFICYKETDNQGRRTPDSVLATELYHELTKEDFKVFFSRITLEDKLGTAYEPYIFAALNSSKVMVALGTRAEYFNSVWVKNEWSRYLSLIKNGAKKTLIPAYRDMDPYDLPEEFSHLQAQDMSKLGFMQDLIRGISKILSVEKPKPTETVVINNGNAGVEPLLKRAFMFLEDKDWNSADDYCEKVLDQAPENAMAYLGKLMAELKVTKQEKLADCKEPFTISNNYKKAIRFADNKLAEILTGYIFHINERNENAHLESIYNSAVAEMNKAKTQLGFEKAAKGFEAILKYKDSAVLAEKCLENAEIARKDKIYDTAKDHMTGDSIYSYESAIKDFETIAGWKDADELLSVCKSKIEALKIQREKEQLEVKRRAELYKEKRRRRIKKAAVITCSVLVFLVASYFIFMETVYPWATYNTALSYEAEGKYNEAIYKYGLLFDYKDAKTRKANLLKNNYSERVSIGRYHYAVLQTDGIIRTDGNNDYGQCDTSDWKNMIAVSVGKYHTVGLKADGTVAAVGYNGDEQCNVSAWEDIITISAGNAHTVGLKADGTVVDTGSNKYGQCNVSDWEDIIAISIGTHHTVGLKADGTVVADGYNDDGECDVSDWKNIIAISAGTHHTVGLKADGTVVAAGYNNDGECDVSDWKNIIAISAGSFHTVGLKADGTVVAVGYNDDGECDVSDWKDIIAISAGSHCTVALNNDIETFEAGGIKIKQNEEEK